MSIAEENRLVFGIWLFMITVALLVLHACTPVEPYGECHWAGDNGSMRACVCREPTPPEPCADLPAPKPEPVACTPGEKITFPDGSFVYCDPKPEEVDG